MPGWTVNGVNTLTIWFRGNVANAAETMYVALNDSAVVANCPAYVRDFELVLSVPLVKRADNSLKLPALEFSIPVS